MNEGSELCELGLGGISYCQWSKKSNYDQVTSAYINLLEKIEHESYSIKQCPI